MYSLLHRLSQYKHISQSFCKVQLFIKNTSYILHYEQFQDGTIKCIEDEIPFELPDGWAWCRVRDIASVKGGKRMPKGSSFSDEKTVHAYIRVTDMKNHTVNCDNLKYISDEIFSQIKNYTISKNDLYITIAGTIGVTGEVPEELDGMNFTENAVKVTDICIDKSYLCIVLQSELVQQQFQSKTHQVTMPKLALERILSTLIPICSYTLQKEIISEFQNINLLISAIDKNKKEMLKDVSLAKSKILDIAIRGKLVPQDPNDEPASALLERIRAEKEELIKQGKIKRDKKESVIFKGDDNSYYEKMGNTTVCIDKELPFEIPDNWIWSRLQTCCCKEIKRGKSPKYANSGNTLVFAQKCNTKYDGINLNLALFLDETTIKKYSDTEFMQNNDIVINSTGNGTLGRVGIYKDINKTSSTPIVPDSHITVIRSNNCIMADYLYVFLKSSQGILEKMGEGSTNQKELKPITLINMLVPIPPYKEQILIVNLIKKVNTIISNIEASLN